MGQVMEERDGDVVRVEFRARGIGPWIISRSSGGELARRDRVEHVGVPEREVAALAVVAAGLLPEAVYRVLPATTPAERERVVQRRVRPEASFRVRRGLH